MKLYNWLDHVLGLFIHSQAANGSQHQRQKLNFLSLLVFSLRFCVHLLCLVFMETGIDSNQNGKRGWL